MSLNKAAGTMSGINIAPPNEALRKGSGPPSIATPESGETFKRALEQVAGGQLIPALPGARPAAAGAPTELKFSNHAIDRMRSRGIGFQPDEMQRISSAVAKAAAKGAKDTLILSGENALIVSVKNNTVVTVMDRAAMKENVFTNIDSTVVL